MADVSELSVAQKSFREKAFLAALTGIMSNPSNTDIDGSIMLTSTKVDKAWKVADLALEKSGLVY